MSAAALNSADFDARMAVYERLKSRNRLVGLLRIVVPALGAILLGVLVTRIIVANLASGFQSAGFTLSREGIFVGTPRYEGTMADGSHYSVTATAATAAFAHVDVVDLTTARLVVVRPDGVGFTATTNAATYDLGNQVITIPGEFSVSDSRGTVATGHDARFDWQSQVLTARGAIAATFADGTTLDGTAATYDAKARLWTVAGAVLVTAWQDAPPQSAGEQQ